MIKPLIILLSVLALGATLPVKTYTLTEIQIVNMLRNRDCNAGCANIGDGFGWWSPKKNKCGCGHWEDPKELMEPKLYLSFQKTYSSGVHSSDEGREEEPLKVSPNSNYMQLRTDIFSKLSPRMR